MCQSLQVIKRIQHWRIKKRKGGLAGCPINVCPPPSGLPIPSLADFAQCSINLQGQLLFLCPSQVLWRSPSRISDCSRQGLATLTGSHAPPHPHGQPRICPQPHPKNSSVLNLLNGGDSKAFIQPSLLILPTHTWDYSHVPDAASARTHVSSSGRNTDDRLPNPLVAPNPLISAASHTCTLPQSLAPLL